jgi:hypothetical protein
MKNLTNKQIFAIICIVAFFAGWGIALKDPAFGRSIMTISVVLLVLILWDLYKKL